MMSGFKMFAEGYAPFVYHVTYLINLPSIAKLGLDFKSYGGTQISRNPDMGINSRSGLFFVNHIMAAYRWISELEIGANVYRQEHDLTDEEIVERGLIPVVLRFRLNVRKQLPDEIPETPHDRKTDRLIPPRGIQVWDGNKWAPVFSPVNPSAVISRPISVPHQIYSHDPDFDDIDSYFQDKVWKQGYTPPKPQ